MDSAECLAQVAEFNFVGVCVAAMDFFAVAIVRLDYNSASYGRSQLAAGAFGHTSSRIVKSKFCRSHRHGLQLFALYRNHSLRFLGKARSQIARSVSGFGRKSDRNFLESDSTADDAGDCCGLFASIY